MIAYGVYEVLFRVLGDRDGQIEDQQGYGNREDPVAERLKTRCASQAWAIRRRNLVVFYAYRLIVRGWPA